MVAGDMLVVERDDVTARRERAQGGEVGVVADGDVGGDEGGTVVGRGGENPQ